MNTEQRKRTRPPTSANALQEALQLDFEREWWVAYATMRKAGLAYAAAPRGKDCCEFRLGVALGKAAGALVDLEMRWAHLNVRRPNLVPLEDTFCVRAVTMVLFSRMANEHTVGTEEAARKLLHLEQAAR